MKTWIFLIVTLCLFPLPAKSQDKLDSLLNKIAGAPDDTNKVIMMLKVCDLTKLNDTDMAYGYTQKAYALAEELDYSKGKAASVQREGVIWTYRGAYGKAWKAYHKAIELHKSLNRPVIAATLTFNLGILYQERGIYDSAHIYNNQAGKVFLAHGDTLKYASVLDLKSSIYNEQGDYFLALQNATDAARLFNQYGDKLREADCLVKVADVYSVLGHHGQSIHYYQTSLQYYLEDDDLSYGSFVYYKLAKEYVELGDFNVAITYADSCLMISDRLDLKMNAANAWNVKGDVYLKKGSIDKALESLIKSNALNAEMQDNTLHDTNMVLIAECYMQQGDMVKAEHIFDQILPNAIKNDVKENLLKVYLNLSKIYEQQGEYNKAIANYKKYTQVKDSLLNEAKSRQIAFAQWQYDTERKEQELALQQQRIILLEQESEIQGMVRNRLIGVIFTIVLLIILIFYILQLRARRNRLRQRLEREQLKHDLELKEKELTTHTLHIVQKNNLLIDLQKKIREVDNGDNGENLPYKEITRMIRKNQMIQQDWDNFKSSFEQVHKSFFTRLKNRHPDISTTELRLAAMMKMNLGSKEMASVLNVSPESVKKARYRLRKKLALSEGEKVHDYLVRF